MQKQVLNVLMLVVFAMFLYASCTSDVIEAPKPVTDTISFSADLQPVFTQRCIGCHSPGATAPNLREGASYESLTSGGYYDTANPEQSKIYQRLLPSGPSHPVKDADFASKVLAWIQQGAKNN